MSRDLIITNAIIHGFTITHAITAAFLGPFAGAALTPMTIAMVIALCGQYKRNNAIQTAMATVSVFIGFIAGVIIGEIFLGFIPFANGVASAIVTEILGWCIYFIVREEITPHEMTEVGASVLQQRAHVMREDMREELQKLKKILKNMKSTHPADYEKYKKYVSIISDKNSSIEERDHGLSGLDLLLAQYGI